MSPTGLPSEGANIPYLIPTDANGRNLQRMLSLSDVYERLGQHPAVRTTLFLDACFSGTARGESLNAGRRSIEVAPVAKTPPSNMMLFTSSSGSEGSGTYPPMLHGYFTYFLLKKLQETKGNVSYGELYHYLRQQVPKASDNVRRQTPDILYSPEIESEWTDWTLGQGEMKEQKQQKRRK